MCSGRAELCGRASSLESKRCQPRRCLRKRLTTDRLRGRFAKFRERRSRVDKDVRRTDKAHPFFAGARNPHQKALRRILMTYAFFNFDLGYCAPVLAGCPGC